ncbi:MAG TPA: hypothetical protein VHJ37_04990 [Thermoleophilaceae bacterium]|nr:hypothetical protein [Thermoleophilaceae bacterium]
MSEEPAQSRSSGRKRSRRESSRMLLVAGVSGLAGIFAVLNLDQVGVNWIIGTWETPLIVVIALSILVGALLGYLVARRRASPR